MIPSFVPDPAAEGHPVQLVRPKFYNNLTFRVLIAIALGAMVGAFFPKTGEAMQPIAKTFINMIKMVIAPIIFLTIVTGIGKVSDIRQFGRIGGKALLYFITVTTFAL
ncbi:cation:dicarboxylase symporter family transporter, partial [Haliscomenobacter sp.]|uniref:cation:dicarboxylate symporter family transporter n=1 Tax=Haliscomenobacter sp. TaxID=2717303 RepID=UPI003365032F